MSLEPITNFRDSNGVDLGSKLITKDYLISVYPSIGEQIGIPPELWHWGRRLGNAAITTRSTPVTTFSGGTNWKQISCGGLHTAAIKTDGTLWTWGFGTYGQLGNAAITDRSTPVTTFAGGTDWKQVECGRGHTAAIKTDGTLWTWGAGAGGRLGNAASLNRSTPVTTFAGGTNWKEVSCGGFEHTAAIKTDGTLWTWGGGGEGKLGNAAITDRSTPVTTFTGGTNWKQVSCGAAYTAAIKTDGTLWTWGNGGELGINNTTDRSTPVTTFVGGNNWKQVSAGYSSAAIKNDGTLWTWGTRNGAGGNNSAGSSLIPVTTFAGGTNWKQVSASLDHMAAIKTDGTLWTWGQVTYGQLGNASTTTNRLTPVTTFAGGTDWKQVSVGWENTVAIRSVDF